MNLIQEIGAYIAAGLTSAETAARLQAEHGITATAAWIDKLRGADGFTLVASTSNESE